jgi:hypothetical protein
MAVTGVTREEDDGLSGLNGVTGEEDDELWRRWVSGRCAIMERDLDPLQLMLNGKHRAITAHEPPYAASPQALNTFEPTATVHSRRTTTADEG